MAEDYPEGWSSECKNCSSLDCHEYKDCILCFDCKHKIILSGFIEIEITEEMNYEANRLGRLQHDVKEGANTSLFQTSDVYRDHIVGKLGEICFRGWLIKEDILFKSDEHYSKNYSDQGDFIIGGNVVDIKTGLMKYGVVDERTKEYNLMIANQQKISSDFYVQIIIDKELSRAYLVGFLFKSGVLNIPISTHSQKGNLLINPARLFTVGDLIPMQKFKEIVIKRQKPTDPTKEKP